MVDFPPTALQLIVISALNLKEIPYDIKPISLVKAGGEQHFNEFREVNPMEQVPALQIDGHTVIESVSIDIFILYDNSLVKLTHYSLMYFVVEYYALFGRNATAETFNASRCAQES